MNNKILRYDEWREQHNLLVKAPKYKKRTRQFAVSNEAYIGLLQLAKLFTPNDNTSPNQRISEVLELIGLYQLSVHKPVELDYHGITTIECYEAGCDDAKEKRLANFDLIFEGFPREFAEAYHRGYLENKQ